MAEEIVKLKSLTKHYGGVRALQDVTLQLTRGEIHALVGENGAGKSTMIRILSGVEPPTEGEVWLEGRRVETFQPYEAHRLGISTVYQEPMQMKAMSVVENIYVGRYKKWGPVINKRALEKQLLALMEEIGIFIPPHRIIRELSVAQRQMVEILKALSYHSKLIIFDEPTASLTLQECQTLERIIRTLKEKGITVVYISHRLEEIFSLCDTVTVLRDGQFVRQARVADIDQDQLIKLMVGRELDNMFPKKSVSIGEDILQAEKLSNKKVHDVSFSLRRGEILGFAGLVGAGRTEVANILFGIDAYSGTIRVDGRVVKITSPEKSMDCGIGLVPEDRKTQGLVQMLTVRENITLSSLALHSKAFVLNRRKERETAAAYIQRLRIKTPTDRQVVRNLSGGNQQKVVFAKWMSRQPRILILDEPTQGVDVGAKAEIFQIINELAENGVGIIMISSEMTELISMSDRICVMKDGRITQVLERDAFSEDSIMHYAIKEDA